MPSRSTHIDASTERLIVATAKLEDRNPSQIMAAALRWYLRISPGARDAMRHIEAAGDKAVQEAAWSVSRALLDREFKTLVQEGMQDFNTDLTADATEDEIMD
jgi:hypothetical protein